MSGNGFDGTIKARMSNYNKTFSNCRNLLIILLTKRKIIGVALNIHWEDFVCEHLKKSTYSRE